mgnify:CR=1 FL=1
MKRLKIVLCLIYISVSIVILGQNIDSTHSPKKSLILSATIPGLGQIYNNKHKNKFQKNNLWWKLPIIYGGIGSTIFLTIDNNTNFHSYRNERLYRKQYSTSNLYSEYSDENLETLQNLYRKWRDMSIISTMGIYLLQLIDSNVEGHLLHFDNSDDLSITFLPNIQLQNNNRIASLSAVIVF